MALKRDLWMEVSLIAAMALVLLIPTFANGFPLVDYDSMSYLSSAYDREIPDNRPVWYSIFALLVDWAITPWPVAVVQALIVATGMWHIAKVMFGVRDWRALLGITAVLTLASSLPWYVGYMTPDIFTPVLIGALMMVGFCWDRMGWITRIIYVIAIATCVSFHYGNVPISLGANVVFALLALLGWRPNAPWRQRFLAMNAGILLGVLALVSATTYDHGKLAMSPSGATFYMARLLDDGSALKVLNRDCATQHWHVCNELADLNTYDAAHRAHPDVHAYRMGLADHFLWGGGVQRLGDFERVEPEAGKVIRPAWATYPGEQLSATVYNAFDQARSFWFGDFLHSWGTGEPLGKIRHVFGARTAASYMSSLQQKNELSFGLLNLLAFALLAASLLFLIYQAALSFRGDRSWFFIVTALLCFLLGNAFVTGVVSGVFANYQARVIWLLPLLALLLAAHRYGPPEAAQR